MKNYKIITSPTTTRYVLESATAGATSAGNVASSEHSVGSIITREGDKNKKVPQKPRQGPLRPQTGGGKHKDKKRAEKQGSVKHKKPFMEDHEVEMASNELKSIHHNAKKLLALVQQYGEQGDLEAWQQSKITKAADYLNSVLQSIGGEHDNLSELKGNPNKPDAKKISQFQKTLQTQKDRFSQQGFVRAADDTAKLQKQYREPISELEKPSGTLYIIVLKDRSESVRVVGDFGTFPAEVQARASKVGIKDKEGRKERPLKVNFLMTDASQALAELDRALADVDFIGSEKAEFVFKNSAFDTDISAEVNELQDLIASGADERFAVYDDEKDVGNEPPRKLKGVDHYIVDPLTGGRKRVPKQGKPSSQMGGHAVQQPKTYTYTLQRTDLAPKLRDMGFKFDGNKIILSKQQRDQLLAKMGDQQFGKIFGQGDRFAEASNQRDKRNPTRDHLRRYPVPQDQMARPVKKDEKKAVAEGLGKNVVKSVKVGNFRHDLVDTGMGWQVRIYNGDELYDTGLSKNSEQKGLAALEDAVAYTEKQTRTKRQGVAEGAKWRSNPDAHDINDDGEIYPKTRDMFAYDPLSRRQSTAGDARTARGKKAALKTSLKMAQGRHGPKGQLPEEQGVAEGSSYQTDSMVSHISQIITDIYPQGGDKNTYMKLVARKMPRIVKNDPKLFRRAFGIAYDKFFHIGQDDDDDSFDYTDYSMRQGERGMEEGPNDGREDNFTIDDIKRLEQIRDLETLKAQAKELIKGKPVRRMKPEKISWFYNHIDTLKSPLAVIKMMYDLMLAGEGHKVIGSRNSMTPNHYRSRFGEEGMEEGVAGPKQCWPGHRKVGTQPGTGKNAGKRVNDCEKIKKEDTYMESLWDQLSTVVNEKAPPGDKYERMVKHIKKGYSKDGKITDKERSIAYATAWKAKNKAKK